SEVESPDEGFHQFPRRRPFGGRPIGASYQSEKSLLVEVFFEHVEAFGEKRDGVVLARQPFEQRQHGGSVAERYCRKRQRHRSASRVSRGNANVEQRRRGRGSTSDPQRAETCRGAAERLLEPGVLIRKP